MRRALTGIIALLVVGWLGPGALAADNSLYWGEARTGVYKPLHPHTLNWSGDVLDKGGLRLETMTVVNDGDSADFVVNQYGAIGARSLVKLDEEGLGAPTANDRRSGTSSATIAAGDMLVVALHDGSYAKIRIERLSAEQMSFSYVLEAERPQQPTPSTGQAPTEPKQPTPSTPQSPSPSPKAVKSSILLVVGSTAAVVQGKPVELEKAPLIVDGNTLVPLRFVAESLGVAVGWDGGERKVTLKQPGGTVIELWIDNTVASVNGRTVKLEVAPVIMADVTMVPVRFISERFHQHVDYNPADRSIAITGELLVPDEDSPDAETGADAEAEAKSPDAAADGEPFELKDYDFAGFAGEYELWVEGAAVPLYYADSGQYATHEYSPGARAGLLSVRADGTFSLKTGTESASGTWRPSRVNEVYGYEYSIILETGANEPNWTLLVNASGKKMVAYADGTWSDGSPMWIPSYIALPIAAP